MTWCDLDGVLVATAHQKRASSPAKSADVWIDGELVHTILCPGALEFLAALRSMGSVRLLTFAGRSYADAMCRHFGLGFPPDDIFAQDAWWGGFLRGPLERGELPAGAEVLVANESDLGNEAKMQWLGPRARLITVPDFTGSENEFSLNWCDYVRRIRHILT